VVNKGHFPPWKCLVKMGKQMKHNTHISSVIRWTKMFQFVSYEKKVWMFNRFYLRNYVDRTSQMKGSLLNSDWPKILKIRI
jgi:hypothetical protein